ncbi:unnamed protein product [Mytilus edulis]|uniref:Uncharacterized protein n=1 Tax=Mytilus edulis TaxID=6550 RepID=A0A8S3TLM6_MYTED|nr:unnamed protein product [Mytilus edulis]
MSVLFSLTISAATMLDVRCILLQHGGGESISASSSCTDVFPIGQFCKADARATLGVLRDSEQRSTLTGCGTFNISLISRKSNSVNSTFTEIPSVTSNPTNLPYASPVNTPYRNGLSRVPRRIIPPLSHHRTFNVASLAPEQSSIEQPTSNTVANSSTNDATPASPSYTPRRNGVPRVSKRILSPLSPNRTYNVVSVAPEQSLMQPQTYQTSRIPSPSLPNASRTHLNRTTSVHALLPLPLDASVDFTHHQDETDD